jgi:hypothetical protein
LDAVVGAAIAAHFFVEAAAALKRSRFSPVLRLMPCFSRMSAGDAPVWPCQTPVLVETGDVVPFVDRERLRLIRRRVADLHEEIRE